jgi:hypothetical protein
MSYVSLLIDLVVAGLLVATIVYASVLNKKLATLRSSKQEMETLAGRLVESTEHAERALGDLKSAANNTGDQLERRVAEARGLVDDLRFLVDKGSDLADRLAGDIDKGRGGGKAKAGGKKGAPPSSPPKRRAAAAEAARGANHSETERRWEEDESAPDADPQLLKALRNVR